MKRLTAVLAATLLLALALGPVSCGYNLANRGGPVKLPPKARSLAIAQVTNPTTFTWLEPRLRSLFRDEITRRGWARWVDRKDASALLYVTVRRYTRNTAVYGTREQTLRYDATLVLSARIVSAVDGSVLWDSGELTQVEPFFVGGETEADNAVTDLAVRQLVDRMAEGY